MEFAQTPDEVEFRTHVRELLGKPQLSAEIRRMQNDPTRDERPLYRMLGEAGLLGVSWPTDFGGQGRSAVEFLIVTEELMRAQVPDTLYVNGIQTVGQLVLLAGTEAQKKRVLPGMARGEFFASVLYSEPDAGSDLGSLTTMATPDDDRFRLNGVKIFSLKSDITDIGLCAARIPQSRSRYDGITLFLIDMRAPGVRVRELPALQDEQFGIVELDDLVVSAEDVIGGVGRGWGLLARALPLERTGMDFALRAERWYRIGKQACGDPMWAERVGRLGARVEAAKLLAWQSGLAVSAGRTGPVETSLAKWYCGELAAELARWAVQCHGIDGPADWAAAVDRAYREAPGMTLSGGTTEMMLQLLSGHLLDTLGEQY